MMGQQIFVILFFLSFIKVGLAQNVPVRDSLKTSKLQSGQNQNITSSTAQLTGLLDRYNDRSNRSNTANATNNSNNGLTTTRIPPQQNNNSVLANVPNIEESQNISVNEAVRPTVKLMIKSYVSENPNTRTHDINARKRNSSNVSPAINRTKWNEASSNQVEATGTLDNNSNTEVISVQNSSGNMSSEVNGTMADSVENIAMRLTNEFVDKETGKHFRTNNSVSSTINEINADQAGSIGSSVLDGMSVSGPRSTESNTSILYTRDSTSVPESWVTPRNAKTVAKNTFVNETNKLPNISWKPGMKQPQTIADLIKATGADVEFIVSQFGNEKINTVNTSDTSVNTSGIFVSDLANFPTNNIHSKDQSSFVNGVDKLMDRTVIEEFDATEASQNNIIELNPGSETGIIQNEGFLNVKEFQSETPQLSNTNTNNAVFDSAKNEMHGRDNSVQTAVVNAINREPNAMFPSIAKTADNPITNVNTREPELTIVVVRKPGSTIAPRINIISNLENIETSSRRFFDFSDNGLRHSREMATPNTIQGSLPRNSMNQADIDSVLLRGNPQYTTGVDSSLQMHQLTAHNRLPFTESTERNDISRMNQSPFRRRPMELGLPDISSDMDQTASRERFVAGTSGRDVSRFVTSGLPSWIPILSSRDLVRSGRVRSIAPRLGYISDDSNGGSRNIGTENQAFEGRTPVNNIFDNEVPRRNAFRASTGATSFDRMPFDRGLDNPLPIDGSFRENVAVSLGLGDMIPRQGRQSVDVVTRSDISGDFSRGQTFGRTILGSRFDGSIASGSEIARNMGFGRGFDRGLENTVPLAGNFRENMAVSSGLGDTIPRQGRHRANVVTRNDISGDFSRGRNFDETGSGFDGSISSGSEMARNIGFGRDFDRGLESTVPVGGNFGENLAVSSRFEDLIPRQGRQRANTITRSDISGDFSRGRSPAETILGSGFDGSLPSGGEMTRNIDYRRDFNRGLENTVRMPGNFREHLAVPSGFGNIVPRQGRQSVDFVTRSDISSDYPRGQSVGGAILGSRFDGSIARGSEMARNIGLRRNFNRGPENILRTGGRFRDNQAVSSGLGDIIPRESRQSVDAVTRSDISGDFSRGRSLGGSTLSGNGIARNIGLMRGFSRPRGFSGRVIPRTIIPRSFSRDISGIRAPRRDGISTAGVFRRGGNVQRIRTQMFPINRIRSNRIGPTGIFGRSMNMSPNMFRRTSTNFVRTF